MESTPQQVEEDVFIGSRQTPPPKLEVPSRCNGLLEDLVILGYVPVPEAVVWGVGCVHQDRFDQLPEELATFKPKWIHSWITWSVVGYDVPVWSVTLLQGGLEIYSPLGVM